MILEAPTHEPENKEVKTLSKEDKEVLKKLDKESALPWLENVEWWQEFSKLYKEILKELSQPLDTQRLPYKNQPNATRNLDVSAIWKNDKDYSIIFSKFVNEWGSQEIHTTVTITISSKTGISYSSFSIDKARGNSAGIGDSMSLSLSYDNFLGKLPLFENKLSQLRAYKKAKFENQEKQRKNNESAIDKLLLDEEEKKIDDPSNWDHVESLPPRISQIPIQEPIMSMRKVVEVDELPVQAPDVQMPQIEQNPTMETSEAGII